MVAPLVLVIEDDPAIRRGVVDALRFHGFRTSEAAAGPSGLELALGTEPDLVLLDVRLPGLDGLSVLEQIRRGRPTLPVILVTARGAESDRVSGLRAGADDYVVKPFSARELVARVEAVLRRSASRPEPVQSLRSGRVRVLFDRLEVQRPDGEHRQLSELEAALLRYLAACRGRAVTREELLRGVWGIDPRGVETRTVDMHVARLRDKLGEDPQAARIIVTVRSKGYMLGSGVVVQ